LNGRVDTKRSVLFADQVYMSEEDMGRLNDACDVILAECGDEEDLIEAASGGGAWVIISEYVPVTSRVMDASDRLRGIVVYGVGYDHVDVEAATERGLYVANARGANAVSVAEHAFALILAVSRRLIDAHLLVREGGWRRREESSLPEWLRQRDLRGRTLGIVGFGAIGSEVSRIARGFGMRVLAHDPYVSDGRVEEAGAEAADLETLLESSDYVTLHCVLNEETRGLIGADELGLMKPTAYLINTSRGGVVVEEDLIKALREGRIAGAGLDVFAEEPIGPGNPLLSLENVVHTPHIAGGSEGALELVSRMVCEETLRILDGRPPVNLVNRQPRGR